MFGRTPILLKSSASGHTCCISLQHHTRELSQGLFTQSTGRDATHRVLQECAIPTISYGTHEGGVGLLVWVEVSVSSFSCNERGWWPNWIVGRRPIDRIIAIVTFGIRRGLKDVTRRHWMCGLVS